jgi:hypothetical protein
MMASTLTGSLLAGASDQEALSGWLCQQADGKLALAFVNKSTETDYRTTLKVPGLQGTATLAVLTAQTSGGLLGSAATGKSYPSTGPTTEHTKIADGSTILVPRASIVTIQY